jgi:hypothetical protein
LLLTGVLAGCVAPPPPLPPQAPLVAVPGPAKTQADFQQDDAACRAAVAGLPPGAPNQPSAEQVRAAQAAAQANVAPPPAEALPPGVAYLRCMTARQNLVQPLAPPVPLYAYYPAYPVYAGIGFGYPFFYDDVFAIRFGYGFGYGRYGYGYGYRGFGGYGHRGYGGYGGFRGGGYRGGFGHGGFGGGRR